MVEVRPSAEPFGVAEIRGAGPESGADDAEVVRAALAQHGVVRLPMPRRLDDGELQALEVFFERSRLEAPKIRKSFWASLKDLFIHGIVPED